MLDFRNTRLLLPLLLASSLWGACSSDAGTLASDAGPADAGAQLDANPNAIGGDRPTALYVPASYDPATPMPLVILLHGYTASGAVQEDYLQVTAHAEERGFLYAYPDGTLDGLQNRFWNATDACCDLTSSGVDDAAYLRGIIDEIKTKYAVDARRVYLVGHSNGGFMAHRMACDHADAIAAIVSLAGAQFAEMSRCQPSQPVPVLQIHGTADESIRYAGGELFGKAYPGAVATAETWAQLDGCALEGTDDATLVDLDSSVEGAETTIRRYQTGCDPGGHVELWTMAEASHLPTINNDFIPAVLDFLFAHPQPE